jgi:hypothetical protein
MMASLKSRPFGVANLKLRVLKYDVDDDRFLRIFGDLVDQLADQKRRVRKPLSRIIKITKTPS